MLVECLSATTQREWFERGARVKTKLPDLNYQKATAKAFEDAWRGYNGGSKTEATAPVTQAEPEEAPKSTPPPPPARPSFEEQLARVERGEVGIVKKPVMKGADPITHNGSSLA
jgi:hypothetical protein